MGPILGLPGAAIARANHLNNAGGLPVRWRLSQRTMEKTYVQPRLCGLILAGFEGTIDTLIRGVDGQVRIELEELGARIADTRLRLDPETDDRPESDQVCPA